MCMVLEPKNSGTKNFYMTPFVCDVTGADPNASPVDIEYAIPPRRCLDPTNCNFGPRNPMYYLGEESDEINMAEPEYQSPHYSILFSLTIQATHQGMPTVHSYLVPLPRQQPRTLRASYHIRRLLSGAE